MGPPVLYLRTHRGNKSAARGGPELQSRKDRARMFQLPPPLPNLRSTHRKRECAWESGTVLVSLTPSTRASLEWWPLVLQSYSKWLLHPDHPDQSSGAAKAADGSFL